MPTPAYRFSARARRDIKGISRRSRANWGIDQAIRYSEALDSAFRRLVEFPDLGRERSNVEAGVRIFPVETHLVLYLVEPDGILILRVVHQCMDLGRTALS